MIMITEPDQLKGNSVLHKHTVTHRLLHLRGLSRPQIRKGWCSHNPFANVWRFKWAPNLSQPKQISGIFCGPRPPRFGLRMWKTSLFPHNPNHNYRIDCFVERFFHWLKVAPKTSELLLIRFSFSRYPYVRNTWELCPQLGFTQQHQYL